MYTDLLYLNNFLFYLKKRGAFLLLSFLLSNVFYGQNSVWAKSGDGNGINYGSSVCSDKYGNVYMVGSFQASTITFGTYTLTNYGTGNVFLVKYDASGNVLWARSGQGNGNDPAYSVTTDTVGNVYLTGSFQGSSITFGTYTLTNSGSFDIFIVKYDTNGNVLWAKKEGAEGEDASFSVKTDLIGNVYIGGYSTSSTLTIGNYTFTNSPGILYLTKYDANANVIWVKSVTGIAGIYALTIDGIGNIIITGSFSSPTLVIDTFTLTGNGSDFFVIKLDSNGNAIWAKNEYGGFGYSLATNDNEDIFLTGSYITPTISIGSYTFANKQTGNFDTFFAKYDLNGNVIWAKAFGNLGNDYGYSVATDVSNVYTTGRFNSSITFGTYTLNAPIGSIDPMYFARFDFDGNLVWATALTSGGGGGNNQNWVCTDKNSNVYITGDYGVNPFNVDGNSLNLTGNRNVFVAKYHFNDVGIKENIKESNFELFPNPVNNILNIQLAVESEVPIKSIKIYNDLGQLVLEKEITLGSKNAIIKTDDLLAGVYTLNLKKSDSHTISKRFIVNR